MAMSSILLLDQSEPKKFKDGLAMSSILDQSEPRLFMNGLRRMLRMNFAHTPLNSMPPDGSNYVIKNPWYNHNHVPLLLLTLRYPLLLYFSQKQLPENIARALYDN